MWRKLFVIALILGLLFTGEIVARAETHYRTEGVKTGEEIQFDDSQLWGIIRVQDDAGVDHYFVVDNNTQSNKYPLLALYVAGTRFIVISEGSDGSADFPGYAHVVIIYQPGH